MRRLRQRTRSAGHWPAQAIWGARSRRTLLMWGEDEPERRPGALVFASRHSSAMGFHDRPADRESHPEALGLGGKEGPEQRLRVVGGNPDAAIGHAKEYPAG